MKTRYELLSHRLVDSLLRELSCLPIRSRLTTRRPPCQRAGERNENPQGRGTQPLLLQCARYLLVVRHAMQPAVKVQRVQPQGWAGWGEWRGRTGEQAGLAR